MKVEFDGLMLNRIRTHRKITLRKMEKDIGISNAYLCQIETGKIKNPSLDVLYKISNYFDLPMELFIVDTTFSSIRYK